MKEHIRKFLSSDYGQKLIQLAHMQGQTHFKIGKKEYKIDYLLLMIAALKSN